MNISAPYTNNKFIDLNNKQMVSHCCLLFSILMMNEKLQL